MSAVVVPPELVGLAPVDVDGEHGALRLVQTGSARFTEPFYEETLNRLLAAGAPGAAIGRDQLRSLVGATRPHPAGLILHTGRCGSTLLCRMLRHAGDLFVASEPGVLGHAQRLEAADQLVAGGGTQVRDILVVLDWLAASRDQRPLVKLSSWQAVDIGWYRAELPSAKVVFLHRPVAEVVASELAVGPGWADELLTDPVGRLRRYPWFATRETWSSPAETYAACWASIVDRVLARPDDDVLVVDYHTLATQPAAVLDRVVEHLGLTTLDHSAALGELDYYAKSPNPTQRFRPAGRHRRADLDDVTAAAVLDVVGDLPARLAASTWRPPHGSAPASHDPVARPASPSGKELR